MIILRRIFIILLLQIFVSGCYASTGAPIKSQLRVVSSLAGYEKGQTILCYSKSIGYYNKVYFIEGTITDILSNYDVRIHASSAYRKYSVLNGALFNNEEKTVERVNGTDIKGNGRTQDLRKCYLPVKSITQKTFPESASVFLDNKFEVGKELLCFGYALGTIKNLYANGMAVIEFSHVFQDEDTKSQEKSSRIGLHKLSECQLPKAPTMMELDMKAGSRVTCDYWSKDTDNYIDNHLGPKHPTLSWHRVQVDGEIVAIYGSYMALVKPDTRRIYATVHDSMRMNPDDPSDSRNDMDKVEEYHSYLPMLDKYLIDTKSDYDAPVFLRDLTSSQVNCVLKQ